MNVRITPRGQPQRTDLYGGVTRIESTGLHLLLFSPDRRLPRATGVLPLLLSSIAEIQLDDEPGDLY